MVNRRWDTMGAEAKPARAAAQAPPEISIRPAHPADARSFFELWQEVVAERRFVMSDRAHGSVGHYRRTFRSSWTSDNAELVATDGRQVVGYLSISREEHPVTRHVASIGVFVAPSWRGRGVGTALMREAVRWARGVGVEKLALTVYPDNAAAIALYRRFGFAEEGRLTGHSKKAVGYRDEIVMGVWLVPPPTGLGAGPLAERGPAPPAGPLIDGGRPRIDGGRP
jgi:L-phenylalanine/L-methionine N-acetyltransferase